MSFDYARESDRVPYPIPRGVHVEGGPRSTGDRHAILVDRDSCRLYELYALHRVGGDWHAGSGATWNLRSDHLRRAAGPRRTPPACPSSPDSPGRTSYAAPAA